MTKKLTAYVAIGLCVCNTVLGDNCVKASSPVITLYFGVQIPLPHPEHPHTIPDAHTDIEMPLRFFDWDVHIKTDWPLHNTRVGTEEALFYLGTREQFIYYGSVPSWAASMGVQPDQIVWYYDGEQPSPGFDSQDMSNAEVNALCEWDPNDPVKGGIGYQKWLQVNLVDVRGPEDGFVGMFDADLSTYVYFASYNGIDPNDVYYIPARSHDHKEWVFTKPGLYEVDIQVSTYFRCDSGLAADLDKNCFVDLDDFSIFAGYWLSEDCALQQDCQGADLTDSGQVGLADLMEFILQWLVCGSPFESECP